MAAVKPKTGLQHGTGPRGRTAATVFTGFVGGADHTLRAAATGFKLKVPATASQAPTHSPKPMRALLQGYGDAMTRSRTAGRPASFRVDVDPEGETIVTPIEPAHAAAEPVMDMAEAPDAKLETALAAARVRGRLRAAEILGGDDMLGAYAVPGCSGQAA